MLGSLPSRLTLGQLAALVGLLYLAIGLSWPDATQYSADGDAKLVQILALRWDHGLRVDFPWPGATLDPDHGLVPLGLSYFRRLDGQIRIAWPLPFAFLSWPFYALLGPRGLFVLPALTGGLSVYLTGRIAEALAPGSGKRALLLVGLATPVFFYGTLFWEHLPALAVALWGVLLLLEAPARAYGRLGLAGVAFAAAAGAFRSDFYVFAVAVIGAAFLAWPSGSRLARTAAVGTGAVLGSLPWFGVNWFAGRHIVPLNAVNNSAPLTTEYLLRAKLGVISHYLVGTSLPEMLRTLFTVAACAAVLLVPRLRRWPSAVTVLLGVFLGAGVTCAVALVRTEYLHGWLLASPVLIFAALAARPPEAAPLGTRIVGLALLLHLLADFALIVGAYPHGFTEDHNLEWGPRYYLGVFPLLAVLAAQRLPGFLAGRLERWPALGLFALSVAIQIVGLAGARARTLSLDRVRGLFADGPDDTALVSDVWFFPALQRDRLFRRPSFTIEIGWKDRWSGLVERLAAGGVRRLQLVSNYDWAHHPFASEPLPPGLELHLEREDETDRVRSIWLTLEKRPVDRHDPR